MGKATKCLRYQTHNASAFDAIATGNHATKLRHGCKSIQGFLKIINDDGSTVVARFSSVPGVKSSIERLFV